MERTVGRLMFATLLLLSVAAGSATTNATNATIIPTFADDSSDVATITKNVALPTSTYWKQVEWNPPLTSLLLGKNQDIYIFQHFEDHNWASQTSTLVLQAFNTTTGAMMFTKRQEHCFDAFSPYSRHEELQQQQLVEINKTHAMFICLMRTVHRNETSGIPTVVVFDVATGKTVWLATAVEELSNGTPVVSQSSVWVTVSAPEDNVIGMTNGPSALLLNLNERRFFRVSTTHINAAATLDECHPVAFDKASNAVVYSGGSRSLFAMRYPTQELLWAAATGATTVVHAASALAAVPTTPGAATATTTTTTVPVLFYRRGFFVDFLDVKTKATVKSISLNDTARFPFFGTANPLSANNRDKYEFHTKATGLASDSIVLLNVKQLANPATWDNTCGLIALDIGAGEVAWSFGFESVGFTSTCEWHTHSSGRYGWLVRQSTENQYQATAAVIDIATGNVLATAGPEADNSNEKDTPPHLQLPAAPKMLDGGYTWRHYVASTLFEDVLLLQFPLTSSGVVTTLFGLRLSHTTAAASATSTVNFTGAFRIDGNEAEGVLEGGVPYTMMTRLAQRVANDTMVVPMYDRYFGNSRLLWTNIDELHRQEKEGNDDSKKSPKSHAGVVIGVVCALVVVVAAVAGVLFLLKKRRDAEGDYEAVGEGASSAERMNV